MSTRTCFMLLALLALAACARELAGREELATIDAVLDERVSYWSGMAQLEANERTRRSALRALKERSAPRGTRAAFVRDIIRDRLSNPGRYARWREQVEKAETDERTVLGPVYSNEAEGLDSGRHAYFWAERLVYPLGDTLASLAATQLIEIGSPAAREALTVAASDLRQKRSIVEMASRALAQRGDVASLARIIATRRAAGDTPEIQRLVLATIQDFPSEQRGRSERALLDTLGKDASRDMQIATLGILGEIGSARSLERLIGIRRAATSAEVKAAADRAIANIAAREGLPPPAGAEPQGDPAEIEKLRADYERQWREEYADQL